MSVLKFGDLDIDDQVNYFLMLNGFDSPPPIVKQEYADSPLVHGQPPTEAWKYLNRVMRFSIKVVGATAADLEANITILEQTAYAGGVVTYCPKGHTTQVYLLAYRPGSGGGLGHTPAGLDISSYFQLQYQNNTMCIVSWESEGFPFGYGDRKRFDFFKSLGVNDSLEKRSGNDFENWVEAVSGGTITANTTDYIKGTCSCKLTTTNGADTCQLDDEDFIAVDATRHHNAKMFTYKNGGTVTLDFDVLCYDSAGTLLDTLSLLTAANPTATTWMDAIKVYGTPVINPVSGVAPAFPVGTTKVKRQIRHDTTVGVVSLDSLWFGDTEYIAGYEMEGSIGIVVPPGETYGDVPSPAMLYISSAYNPGPWSPEASGVSTDLFGTVFADSTHGWAVGASGAIRFYNGLVWAGQTSGIATQLNAISTADATHLWAVGAVPAIRYSADGSTWSGQTYPAASELTVDGTVETWSSASVLTNWTKHLYSASTNLARTTPGAHGGTYYALMERTDFPGGSISMNIESNAFIAINPSRTYTCSMWVYRAIGNAGAYFRILFYDSGGVYLGSYDPISDAHGVLTTWTNFTGTLSPANFPTGTTQVKIQIWAYGSGMTTGYDDISFKEDVSSITLYGCCAVSTTVVYAVGSAGHVIGTTNGGTTWTEKTSGTTYDLNAIDADAATRIIAVGDHGTILTSADGTTWTARTSGTTEDLLAIYALDATHAWAVGKAGTILFSANAGATWTPQASGTSKVLSGVYAYDATNVWAVGADGVLLFFNGTTWTSQGSGTNYDLNAISGVSATSAWAVGDMGTIIHGIATAGAMPLTNLAIGQKDIYSSNYAPIQDAVGTTQTLLYTRHGQYYRAMAAGATNKFRFPVGAHRGRYIISIGMSQPSSDATYDTVNLSCYLEDAGGNRMTATSVTPAVIHLGNPNTKWVEIENLATRLSDFSIPSHYVSPMANEDNIYQVFELTVPASGPGQQVDCMTLIPVDRCVEFFQLAQNFLILDGENRVNLSSLDGSLDTAAMYDPTKMIDSPRFQIDPGGMNFTLLAGNIVSSSELLNVFLNLYATYRPYYFLIPEAGGGAEGT